LRVPAYTGLPYPTLFRSRGRHLGDVAHLPCEIRGHHVDRVGQVLPRAGDALDVRLPAELPFAAHLARHARDLAGERTELIDHGVDGVLQLQDLAARIDGDLLRQIAVGHGGGYRGDVARRTARRGSHGVEWGRRGIRRPSDA